jgi:oligopeptide/dipeptide ABC transporter ATP-binding protein
VPPLVEIENLAGFFKTYGGNLRALNGVTLAIEEHKITGLVGETGSGKSVTAMAILRLLPENFVLTSGTIRLHKADLLGLSDEEMRQMRGKRISMVFQDARAALNPVFSVGEQLERVAREHAGISKAAPHARVIDILTRVQIPEPERRAKQYAHEFSGGMAQRVMIAMALIHSPELLLLDEPTTGLDVTIQAEIMELIRRLIHESGVTALLITHDLGVVAEVCDLVAVMYAGQIVEFGTTEQIFERPSHPYTRELLRASLSVESAVGEFYSIPGTVPDLRHPPPGCLFASRCPDRADICSIEPAVAWVGDGQLSKCHFAVDFSRPPAVQARETTT